MYKNIVILHFLIGIKITYGCRNEVCTYQDLPPAFALDDYDNCLGTYCLVEFEINTRNNGDSKLIKFIEEYSSNFYAHFNRTLLRRGVCLEECMRQSNMSSDIENLLVECENKKLKEKYNMSVTVKDIEICKEKGESYPVDILDYAFGAFVIVLVGAVIIATLADGGTTNVITKAFSLKNNWKTLIDDKQGKKFNFLNGIKFLLLCVVITSHSALLYTHIYPANPHYFEKIFESGVEIVLNGRVLMQSFFIMSAFLNTYNFICSYDGKVYSLSELPICILGRWCRLVPTLLFMVLLVSTWLPRLGNDVPLWWKMVEVERAGCRAAWWRHFLLISNMFYFEPACMSQTWSVSADMHLSVLSLFVLMVIWRNPLYKVSLLSLLIFGFVILAVQTCSNNLSPVMMALNPEEFRKLFVDNGSFQLNYVHTQANIAAYVFGMITAFFYRDMELGKKSIADNGIFQALKPWSLYLCALCWFSGIHFYPRSVYEYNLLEVNIFVIVTVFVYDCGFCVLLLRLMSENLIKDDKSLVRKFLEHPWMTILGRLTYSALMVHVVVITTNLGQIQTQYYFSTYHVVLQVLTAIILTFIYATLLHLFVELPFCSLLKLFIGKLRNKKHDHIKNNVKSD